MVKFRFSERRSGRTYVDDTCEHGLLTARMLPVVLALFAIVQCFCEILKGAYVYGLSRSLASVI